MGGTERRRRQLADQDRLTAAARKAGQQSKELRQQKTAPLPWKHVHVGSRWLFRWFLEFLVLGVFARVEVAGLDAGHGAACVLGGEGGSVTGSLRQAVAARKLAIAGVGADVVRTEDVVAEAALVEPGDAPLHRTASTTGVSKRTFGYVDFFAISAKSAHTDRTECPRWRHRAPLRSSPARVSPDGGSGAERVRRLGAGPSRRRWRPFRRSGSPGPSRRDTERAAGVTE